MKACGAIGAIDFARARSRRARKRFDLVLDLSREPLIRTAAAAAGLLSRRATIRSSRRSRRRSSTALVGEFEKPRFFALQRAHLRAQPLGARPAATSASTSARAARSRADGDHVKVEPHLCVGCGGCATVCPSGAMTYAYPRVPDMGARLKTLLATYREAGGKDACLLFHDAGEGRARGAAKLGARAASGPAGARDPARDASTPPRSAST